MEAGVLEQQETKKSRYLTCVSSQWSENTNGNVAQNCTGDRQEDRGGKGMSVECELKVGPKDILESSQNLSTST